MIATVIISSSSVNPRAFTAGPLCSAHATKAK
jgi:hypothetical protein